MSTSRGDTPRKTDRFEMTLPPLSQNDTPQRVNYFQQDYTAITNPTNPWAVASFALAILALLGAGIHLMIPLFAGALAILCGAIALATVLVERKVYGFWMSLLAISVASLPLLLSALVVFLR